MNTSPSFFRLAAAEPFRIFFPLGILLGITGVSLWPLHYAGIADTYPLLAHMRFMIHGFLGCFIIGFLLTAGPRLLKIAPPSPRVIVAFFTLSLSNAIALSFNQFALADILFLTEILGISAVAAVGFPKHKDLPPPGFVLAAAGILSAIAGSILMLRTSTGASSGNEYELAKILLFQAFPILPLIGIGAFFFPKLSGGPNTHDLPVNAHPTLTWSRHAMRAAGIAALFIVSIPIELEGNYFTAYTLRALSVALYLCIETPIFRRSQAPRPQQKHLVICNLALVCSLAAVAVFPLLRAAWLHGFFICSLTGSIILVSTRVVLGHSGNFPLVLKSKKPLLWGVYALLLAAATRIFADFMPALRVSHYIYAAVIWLFVVLAWLIFIAPKLSTPDPDDSC